MKQSWYEIRNAEEEEAEVFIYDEIGFFGILAGEFVKELRAITARVINLHVNSPGGDVFDGVAIYNSLKNHPASVHAIVDGLAASSASFITQAGDRVSMAPGSAMMIHEPYGMVVGSAGDMERMAETLGKIGDTIAGIYAGRAGGTEADWRERMVAETWYRAQEAVNVGLADAALGSNGQARADVPVRIFNLAKFKRIPDWLPQSKAIASHSTATSEDAWDGPGNKARLRNDETAPYYRKAFAWVDPEADADTKSAYKFIHHEVGGDGEISAANMRGCSAGIAVLNGGRGGTTIPDEDRQGVWNHLAAHLRDGDREPPPLDELADPIENEDDPLAEVDWAGVLGEYARYNAPEPNLEKLLAEHPVEQAFSRKDDLIMEIPDTLEGIQELMKDPKRMGQVIRDGQLEELVVAHEKLTDERGPMRDMIMEAVTAGVAGAGAIEERVTKAAKETFENILKEHGVNRPNLASPEHPQPGTGAKVAACYNPTAPGVKMEEVGFANLGDFTKAIWHRNPFPDNRLPEVRKVMDAYSSVEPSAGGFLIPETMRSEIMQLALEESIVRPRATVITLTTPTQSIPFVDVTTHSGSVLGGMIFYWTEEGGTPTITEAKFGRVKLQANKLMGLAAVPNELWNDAAALSSWLMQALPKGIAFYEDLAFLTGNGTGQPLGVLESPALIAVDKEADQPADSILVENILNMFSSMLPGSLSRAVWIANINTFKELMTLSISVGVGGLPVSLVDIRSAPLMTMLSRPLIFTEKVPTVGDQGDIGFYDLSYYLIGDRQAVEVSTSEHAYFTSDQTALKPVERVDGRPWVQSAIQPVHGSTLSPYVALEART